MQAPAGSEVVFERSFAKTAAMLAGALLLTGMSYFFISRRILNFAFEGWLLGVICGPVAILANGVALFRSGPQVVLDETGIHDARTFGLIPWSEIVCIRVGSYLSDQSLCLYLADESARLKRQSIWSRLWLRLNRVKGWPAFNVRLTGLTPGIREALAYLEKHHLDKIHPVLPDTARAADSA